MYAPAKACVRPYVLEVNGLFRFGVQQPFNARPLVIFHVVVFFRPRGFRLDNERFTVGIELICHSASSILVLTMHGKKLIAILVATCLAAAGYAWWHRQQATHRAARYWGAEAANLVRLAPQLEWLAILPETGGELVERANSDLDLLDLGGRTYVVTQRRNVSGARGLLHLRHALLADASYRWMEAGQPDIADAPWEQLLRFSRDDRHVDVLLSEDRRVLGRQLGHQRQILRVRTTSQFARGLEVWLEDAVSDR